MLRRALFAILPLLLLGACGEDNAPAAKGQRDPQVAQALDDPLMTDPDLSSRNEGAAALTVESDFSQPVIPATPEEVAAAKAAAAEALGGADRLAAPGEPGHETNAPFAPFIDAACRKGMARSAIWAARLPAAFPVYPRGHTLAASGSDGSGCRVRDVTFATAVSPEDVMAFYAAEARQTGQPANLSRADGGLALAGARDALRFEVRARTEGDHTIVRLATRER